MLQSKSPFSMQFAQVGLDVARAHAGAIERQHLFVEAVNTPLSLLHQRRLEGPLAGHGAITCIGPDSVVTVSHYGRLRPLVLLPVSLARAPVERSFPLPAA